jgi:hypothetical protein
MHRPEPRTPFSNSRSASLPAWALLSRSASSQRSASRRRTHSPPEQARPDRSVSSPPDLLIAARPRLRDRVVARLRAGRLDAALAAGVPEESNGALSLHARRLTARGERTGLARSLRRALYDARVMGGYLRVPVARARVRDAEAELSLLVQRLEEPGPVAARGVALTRALLADGTGPLYEGPAAHDLGALADRAADALLVDG